MQYLDLTLPSPAHNLACDEALLESCEDGYPDEILRFWEPREHFVVLGYSSKTHADVKLAHCRTANIPVLRRCSGGGTVLQGPGCLNFSLVLQIDRAAALETITAATRWILTRHQHALEPLVNQPIALQGLSDLTIGGRKFSGNAQRRKRGWLLFHGSVLLQFNLALIERMLPIPSRQPSYRHGRAHQDFLVNLGLPAKQIKHALLTCWGATTLCQAPPLHRVAALVKERYATDAWNLKW